MPVDLRTRIIAALYDGGEMPAAKAARLADAVIRELGLRQEHRDGSILRDGFGQPIRVIMPKQRYVTEWTENESDD